MGWTPPPESYVVRYGEILKGRRTTGISLSFEHYFKNSSPARDGISQE